MLSEEELESISKGSKKRRFKKLVKALVSKKKYSKWIETRELLPYIGKIGLEHEEATEILADLYRAGYYMIHGGKPGRWWELLIEPIDLHDWD